MSINYVIGLGRIASDFNKRMVKGQEGEFVAIDFSLAISTYSRGNEETCFVRAEATGKLAENVVKYFQKGDLLVVGGRLRSWQTKKDDGTISSGIRLKVEELGYLPSICPHCGKRLIKDKATAEETPAREPDCDTPF